MADAWATLIDNSTLVGSYDAWEHLNAQGGGGLPGEGRYVSDKAISFSMKIKTFGFDTRPVVQEFDEELR